MNTNVATVDRESSAITHSAMKVDRLMALAFFPGRPPRSLAYQEGCRAALEHRIQGKRMHVVYAAGTCEADAWFAGVDEGHCIGRKLYDTVQDH